MARDMGHESFSEFAGRTALVTGAGSGIGACVARWLSRHDIGKLILVDISESGLNTFGSGCEIQREVGDVSDPGFWETLESGLGPIDYCIVNAGIGGGGEIADLSLDEWRRIMSVNLDGAFMTLRAGLRAMRENGGGAAVVVSSITGIKPVPGIGPYGVAKAGVAHMARIAAAENAAHNIRVNAVAPGGVDTSIWDEGEQFRQAVALHGRAAALKVMASTTPRGQFATPDELAGEIGFLLSDMAANITGTVLVSDGGFSF
ncbi:SDR family oxidoreductase [Altererythrobacter aquiaggeris]|uniref:SDR family NAD(P)-dependent oxidoreductase n=1 Tax=Aestuarierythrobacter aquiaggeris TaxID=1898396 RepID=UPI003018237F